MSDEEGREIEGGRETIFFFYNWCQKGILMARGRGYGRWLAEDLWRVKDGGARVWGLELKSYVKLDHLLVRVF